MDVIWDSIPGNVFHSGTVVTLRRLRNSSNCSSDKIMEENLKDQKTAER